MTRILVWPNITYKVEELEKKLRLKQQAESWKVLEDVVYAPAFRQCGS